MSNDSVRADGIALPKLDPSIAIIAALIVSEAMHRGSSKRLSRALGFLNGELWRAHKEARSGGSGPTSEQIAALTSARDFLCRTRNIADQRIERGR